MEESDHEWRKILGRIPFDGRIRFRILKNQTMNGERYLDVLKEIVVPMMTSMRYNQCHFQQDGASVHWTIAARQYFNDHLPNRWIGCGVPIQWPPRSPYLSLNDFWLWSCIREAVFKHPRANSLDELERRVKVFLENIDVEQVQRAYQSFENRCNLCILTNGTHIQQYL